MTTEEAAELIALQLRTAEAVEMLASLMNHQNSLVQVLTWSTGMGAGFLLALIFIRAFIAKHIMN